MNLSSPNRLVNEYFHLLRRLARGIETQSDGNTKRQDVAMCVIMAVTAVEAFFNIFFRVVVSEAGYEQHEALILGDLQRKRSIEHKLRRWPKQILGTPFDLDNGAGKAFAALKDKRNQLMHFTSSHSTVSIPGLTLRGMADTSIYEELGDNEAWDAIATAEGVVAELCRLRGTPEKDIKWALQHWTGKITP